jgi:hypothetical protein
MSLKFNPHSSESTYEVSTPLCKSKIRKIDPNDLIRERGYEVLDDPRFKQIIEVEECEDLGSPCNCVVSMKTHCRQRYMGIQLRVTTSDKKEKMENFMIPSACECAFVSQNSRDLQN